MIYFISNSASLVVLVLPSLAVVLLFLGKTRSLGFLTWKVSSLCSLLAPHMSVMCSWTALRPSASQARIFVGKLDGHPSFQESTKLRCHKGDVNISSEVNSMVWYKQHGWGDQAQLIPTQFCHL